MPGRLGEVVWQLNSGGGVAVKTGEGVTQFKFEFYILKSKLVDNCS